MHCRHLLNLFLNKLNASSFLFKCFLCLKINIFCQVIFMTSAKKKNSTNYFLDQPYREYYSRKHKERILFISNSLNGLNTP